MLLRVEAARVRELLLQLQHAHLAARHRRRDPTTDVAGALLHAVDLPLDHRQPVLLAAQRDRRRLELLPHAGGDAQVRLRLLRQPAHVGFLGRAEPRLDLIEARLARGELRGDERGGVFRTRLPRPRAGLHEDTRKGVGHALRLAGCRARVREQKRIELQPLPRHLLQQLRGLYLDAIGLEQPVDGSVDVAVWCQVLVAHHLLQHRPAEELLGDCAYPLVPRERPGLLQQLG